MFNERKKQLVDEVIRLSEPGRPCTRKVFREESDFTEHSVVREFGNWTELLRAAELKPGRVTNSFNNRRAALASGERFEHYWKEEIYPRQSNWEEKRDQKAVKLAVASDFHGEHTDRFMLEVWLDTLRNQQPDHVNFNGDLANFEPVSRWAKNPNRLCNLQNEIDFITEEILVPSVEAAPNATFDLTIGNHENWLCKFLSEQAAGLASLRCLSFSSLFKLDELGIGLVHGGSVIAPNMSDMKKASSRAYKTYYDTFVVTHGTSTGPSAAASELRRFKMSGCSGHLHSPSVAYDSSPDRPQMEWHVTPKMCSDSVAEYYGGGLPLGWYTGFAMVDIFPETKTHFFNPVIMKNDMTMVGGTVYRKP